MKFSVRVGPLAEFPAEALVLGVPEGESSRSAWLQGLGGPLRAAIEPLLAYGDLNGKSGVSLLIPAPAGLRARRLFLLGLGSMKPESLEPFRKFAAAAAQRARELRLSTVSFAADPLLRLGPVESDLGQSLLEGAILGQFQMTALRSRAEDPPPVSQFDLICGEDADAQKLAQGAELGQTIGIITWDARNLVSLPGNLGTPERIADEALKLSGLDRLKVHVLDEKGIRRERMHALLAVAQGSQAPPRFVILEYGGQDDRTKPIALVGKGVTFDTGGINLKSSKNIEYMNYDKSGGIAVIAALRAAASLALPVRAIGLVPLVENMVGGAAMRPGDIIKTRSGKSVEVNNTDAEGRLILADALDYAQSYQPAAIVDIATLTGACVVALGDQAIGLMGTDEPLKQRIREAAGKVDEKVWELPIWDDLDDHMKSDVADLKNAGGSSGGAITAAAFLKGFTGGLPWAHLDIAGPAWSKNASGYINKGATAAGTRLLIQLLRDWSL